MRDSPVTSLNRGLRETKGHPRFNRRLSDKLLAAFNHAYAIGQRGTADRLRDLLGDMEERRLADGGNQRCGPSALAQADLWVEYVKARDDYRRTSEADPSDQARREQAVAAMKVAYRRWSSL